MLGITVITVGRIKEKYFTDAAAEYQKRLGRYCRLNLIEVKEESIPENPSEGQAEIVLKREGERILAKIPKSAYVIALCIEGKQLSSVELSEFIQKTASDGKGDIVFVIGGSLGICGEVKRRADHRLSFSKMTFPHQLMKVVLLEQIYRALNIADGGKYHK